MLLNCSLIQIREGGGLTYVATEKGQGFLKEFTELKKHAGIAESKRRWGAS